MILDASAVIAVMTREPVADSLIDKMAAGSALGMGAPSLAETAIVLSSKLGRDAQGLVARFCQEFMVDTVPFDGVHWRTACEAFVRYGKGRHPARLNFGDCMAYATAKVAGMPLLFVGDDFGQTDIQVA